MVCKSFISYAIISHYGWKRTRWNILSPRLIDIPRPHRASVVADMESALVINREVVILSERMIDRNFSNEERNFLRIYALRKKSIFRSDKHSDVWKEPRGRGIIRKQSIRIRPTWRGLDEATRIFIDQEMMFNCTILDDERGEIRMKISSTTPLVIEGARVDQDFIEVLREIDRTS